MTDVVVGTFNVENLFQRYRQLVPKDKNGNPKPVDPEKLTVLSFERFLENTATIGRALREWTARVITTNTPDVLAVQEVESLEALDQFNREYLKRAYPYMILVDGNDPRLIDVGLLSKFELTCVRTHRFEPKGAAVTRRIFARDCLEVAVEPAPGQTLRLYVNHFTSKLPKVAWKNGEKIIHNGEARRAAQAKRLVEILRERHGDPLAGNFVVLGDLNMGPRETEFAPLRDAGLVNLLERLPAAERWTHYYDAAKAGVSPVEQFDYLLLSPALAAANPQVKPFLERRGLPDKTVKKLNASGGQFGPPITGHWTSGQKGEASDHCGFFAKLTLA